MNTCIGANLSKAETTQTEDRSYSGPEEANRPRFHG